MLLLTEQCQPSEQHRRNHCRRQHPPSHDPAGGIAHQELHETGVGLQAENPDAQHANARGGVERNAILEPDCRERFDAIQEAREPDDAHEESDQRQRVRDGEGASHVEHQERRPETQERDGRRRRHPVGMKRVRRAGKERLVDAEIDAEDEFGKRQATDDDGEQRARTPDELRARPTAMRRCCPQADPAQHEREPRVRLHRGEIRQHALEALDPQQPAQQARAPRQRHRHGGRPRHVRKPGHPCRGRTGTCGSQTVFDLPHHFASHPPVIGRSLRGNTTPHRWNRPSSPTRHRPVPHRPRSPIEPGSRTNGPSTKHAGRFTKGFVLGASENESPLVTIYVGATSRRDPPAGTAPPLSVAASRPASTVGGSCKAALTAVGRPR